MLDPEKKCTVVNRLKSIEGHIRDIERMVEKDVYCMDILAYNVAAIPIAAGGLVPFFGPHYQLNPMIAAGAMACSGIFVE